MGVGGWTRRVIPGNNRCRVSTATVFGRHLGDPRRFHRILTLLGCISPVAVGRGMTGAGGSRLNMSLINLDGKVQAGGMSMCLKTNMGPGAFL